jgi:glycosyltransferase involved in cell wall biosynthesis
MSLISVIVTTYNWPNALRLCLHSLYAQKDINFEIIVADDGSNAFNVNEIERELKTSPIRIIHVHHEDKGFRAGTIRNKAVARASGDYLLFIDGDCIVRSNFISRHRRLAEKGFFVPGNRVLLSQSYTQQIIEQQILLHQKSLGYFLISRIQNKINRLSTFLYLPLGFLRVMNPNKWDRAMTCNLGVWKQDFLNTNGFDELFEGWGYEDSDFVIRLIHSGVKRKEGRFAVPVLHLWHPQNDKSRQNINYQRLMDRLADKDFVIAESGVSQYIK